MLFEPSGSLIGKNYPRYAKVKFLSTGHTSIWWDQVQARRVSGKKEKAGRDNTLSPSEIPIFIAVEEVETRIKYPDEKAPYGTI
ncbi:hypothetical protein COLO4_08919 [Corchorus olitorius]|uniref:Uncharacterized protein n=1 Tax=Corchorus olitorius TaxID=93759 RepID=A0A1R3KE06_9ROSI|nr:hypothetical protein COLO4_08919 [Corchorus olitorius]